jgi:hypothetical protein
VRKHANRNTQPVKTVAAARRYVREENNMNELDRIAARFVSQQIKNRRDDRVVISRPKAPSFLAGFTPSGRAAWTHSIHLAQLFEVETTDLSEAMTRAYGTDQEVAITPILPKSKAAGA